MNDLASGTSSGSTKLIHGGLRYLEHYEFRLVREALMEREVLWKSAPHIIWPLRFVLPYAKGLRPAWLIRLGLFLYDHLGGRKLLPATRTLDLTQRSGGQAAEAAVPQGFRIFRLLGERCPAGRAERPRRGRARRRDPHPREGRRGAPRGRPLGDRRRGPARGARRRGEGAAGGQRRRPVGRRRAGRRGRPERRAQCPARPGQPHRRAEDVRRSARLFLPERRRPHHLRHSLRGRLHADRHDRPGLCGRSAAEPPSARPRSTISAARRASISPSRCGRERHRLDLFRRAPALRRRRLEGAGGDARLRAEGRRPATARRRSSTSSAARSPPIAGSPKRCWRRSRASSAPRASRGRPARRCRAAISPRPASTRRSAG